ncbi:MAG: hypothetical protein ACRC5C_14320 [Bacilli bacterium]
MDSAAIWSDTIIPLLALVLFVGAPIWVMMFAHFSNQTKTVAKSKSARYNRAALYEEV